MQRKQSVSRAYRRLSPLNKVVLFLKVHGKMSLTGSMYVNPSLVFTYALGEDKINAITTAINAGASGGDGTAEAVVTAVDAAESFIDNWADLVDLLSGGDPDLIIGAGFEATKGTSAPTAINGQPTLDYTPQKQTGTVLLSTTGITVVACTVSYIFGSNLDTLTRSGDLISCTDESIKLLFLNGGKKDVLVTGLPSGASMQCVCVVTSTAGTSLFSNVIKFKVP